MRYKRCTYIGLDRSIIKGILLREQCAFSAESRLALKGFSWKWISVTLHACATNGTSLLIIGQSLEHFTWRSVCLFTWISASTRWIFLKIHTSHSLCMGYKYFKFYCYCSKIKGTLHREHCAFSAVLGLHWKDTVLLGKGFEVFISRIQIQNFSPAPDCCAVLCRLRYLGSDILQF
jgi:hypothetical protein